MRASTNLTSLVPMLSVSCFLLLSMCAGNQLHAVSKAPIRIWTYEELFRDSDLVVIARPIKNTNADSHSKGSPNTVTTA